MGESIDTHRTRGVRFVADPLARMADRIGSVILGIAHFNKVTGTECEPYSRVRAALDLRIRSRRDGRQQGYDAGQEPPRRDDLPSLGYKIETTQLHVVRGVATCFLLEQANMVAPAIADLVSQ